MLRPAVRIAPQLLGYLQLFHPADFSSRADDLAETLQFLANSGRNMAHVQAALLAACEARNKERLRNLTHEGFRRMAALRDSARRATVRAITRLKAWQEETGEPDDNSELAALRDVLAAIERWPTDDPYIGHLYTAGDFDIDKPARRARAGRPWVHSECAVRLKALGVPREERQALLHAIGLIT